MTQRRHIAVDLFAGGGGLSLGAQRAGFKIHSAIELSGAAAATYRKNLPRVAVLEKDIRLVTGGDLLSTVPKQRINLLMGCAPCQGFCSLTRTTKREDPRNSLVLEMARIVAETRPDMVLMENVPELATRGKKLFRRFLSRLKAAGYVIHWKIVQMADYGVPQNRRRLVVLAGRGFLVPFPDPTHARAPKKGAKLKKWLTLRDAISNEAAPVTLSTAQRQRGPRAINWHVVRDLQPQTKARLRAARPGGTWLDLKEELRPNCHRGGYVGFRNVYGRMTWDQLPVTITAGCTTPAKGRFGHPRRHGTISVREAATIQTFPKSYRFATDKIDVACDIVGNAVPPLFAEHLGRAARKAFIAQHSASDKRS